MSTQFTLPNNPIGWQARPHDYTGDNMLGIYTQETTQRYVYGTRYITWDGRVFKYGYCGSTITSMKYGVKNYNQLVAEKTSPTATVGAAVAGDTCLVLTATAGTIGVNRDGVIAEDALAGGFISMYQSSSDRSQRMIIGNDALAAAGTTLRIYIEAPVMATVTAATATEVCANPYSDLRWQNSGAYGGVMGMPCVVATTAYNFWLQSWGICRVTPNASAYGTNAVPERQCVFDNAGSVAMHITTVTTASYQHAGFIVERVAGTAEDAAPFVMLQISI